MLRITKFDACYEKPADESVPDAIQKARADLSRDEITNGRRDRADVFDDKPCWVRRFGDDTYTHYASVTAAAAASSAQGPPRPQVVIVRQLYDISGTLRIRRFVRRH